VISQPKVKRLSDKPYLAWIKSLNCSACKKRGGDSHHVNPRGYGSISSKCGDDRAIPLCRPCHSEYHSQGRDTFASRFDMDYEVLIDALRTVWRLEDGTN
jgi:hypothetical protein